MTDWKDFKNFFVGNLNAYGLQTENGRWKAVRKKINKALILKHLRQDITIGSYYIYRRSNRICCKWICLDIDLHPFKIADGTKIINSQQIADLSFPVKLYGKRKTMFMTPQELEEYYWERSGLIVYEKTSKFSDKNAKLRKIWIDDTPYYFKEKYKIECSDKKKLAKLVYEIEMFLMKFYNIPRNAICREASGRGFHIWIRLKDMTTLKRAYDFKTNIENKIRSFFGVEIDEVNPKQDDIGDIYKCPYCGKKNAVSVYERAKFVECSKCQKDIELNEENFIEEGLGNFVKLPLSINRNVGTECKILDNRGFELSKQEEFKITKLVKRIRKKARIERRYNPEETEIDLTKWKPLDKDDNYFYSKLRYCMKQVVKGRQTHKVPYSHNIRRTLANELFKLKAPLETRIRAFERQADFDPEDTKYQVEDLEMRCRRANRFFVSPCSNIAKWGFCYENCPMRYRARDITDEEIAEILFGDEDFGIKGGWSEVRQLLNEKINGNSNSKDYIVKTTRSGTTTNVILETVESDKKLLMIAPTIRICEVTVEEALELTNKDVKIFRLGSNKDLCLRLLERVRHTQALGRFPFLLKENCRDCQYAQPVPCTGHTHYNENCPLCRIATKEREKCNWMRAFEDIQDYDIIYITIAKMYALTKTTDADAQHILDTIYDNVDVVFLDEISNVLDIGSEGIVFKEKADDMYREIASEINFKDRFERQYEQLYEYIHSRLTEQQKQIWYALEDFVKAVNRVHTTWAKLNRNDEFHLLNSPLHRVLDDVNRVYTEDDDLDGSADGDWLSIYQLLIEYAEETDYYPYAIVDLMILAKYPQFYIQYTSPLRYIYRMELLPAKPVREFIDFLNRLSERRKFFTTDATEPPIDISQMFPNIDELIINDPMNTAKTQIVYPDKQSINISKIKALKFYLKDIKEYCEKHGNPNTMIICQNIITSRVLREVLEKGKHYKHLTYFRSPRTIGTPSKCRTIITIGSPYPPKNSHRWLADLFIKQNLVNSDEYDIESLTRHLEYYNAKSQFFQAISRGKDPKGEVKSEVYTYGLNKFQVVQLLNFPIAVPDVK